MTAKKTPAKKVAKKRPAKKLNRNQRRERAAIHNLKGK